MSPYRRALHPDDLPGGPYRTEHISHIDDHLRWMRKSGRTDSTLRARRASLTRLAEHIGHDPATATLAELEAWQDSLPSLAAVRHQTQMIRPYYAWLQARGHRADNPAALLPMPRRPKRLPHPIAEDTLMQAVDQAPARVLPWLLLAGWAGMRASDIARMHRDRIHVDQQGNRYARVVGKGDVERDVAIPSWVWDRIEPLMWSEGWCWRRERGPGKGVEPRTAQHISQYCNEYLHATVGVPDVLHSLRHRVGTGVLDGTGNPRVVQEVLGHANLAQTQVYTHIAGAARSEAVERLPRPPGAPVRPPVRDVAGARALDLSDDEIDQHLAAWTATYRSVESRNAYERDVEAWRAWCTLDGVRLGDVRRSHVERYRVWLETVPTGRGGDRYAPATVMRRMNGASAFYRWLTAEGVLARNPFLGTPRPLLSLESTTPGLSRDEAAALVEAAQTAGELEAALVWVLFATALRVSELVTADLRDVTDGPFGMHLHITAKGGRRAQVSIPGPAADAVRAWLAARPATPSKALLVRSGLRLHRRTVHTLMNRLTKQAGVTRISAHGLRHTAATLLLDAGVSVWDVQAHLRHRNIDSTLRYDRARRARAGKAATILADMLAPVAALPATVTVLTSGDVA